MGTTGTTTPTKKEEGTPHLDYECYRFCRRAVGKLLWLVSIHPDLRCVSKELRRALQSPTYDNSAKRKHANRFPKGRMTSSPYFPRILMQINLHST